MENETLSIIVEDFSPNYVFRDHAKEFTDKNGIATKLEMYTEQELREKMTKDISEHTARYDVLLLTKQEHSLYAKSNSLVDLSQLISDRTYTTEQESESIAGDIYPSFIQYNKWNGKLIALHIAERATSYFIGKTSSRNFTSKYPRRCRNSCEQQKRCTNHLIMLES